MTRVDGKIAYVDDQGFETPFQVKELVVVLPAGHKNEKTGAALMFDQEAFDAGKTDKRNPPMSSKDVPPGPTPAPLPPAEETDYGDRLTISLAFEPADPKRLSETTFNAVLVNDSNYTLQFFIAGRAEDGPGWKIIYQGDVGPNELIDLAQYTHETIGSIERIVFQAIAFKTSKAFDIKDPIAVIRKLDLTKFHKFHCFHPGRFFETPVLEFPLLDSDRMQKQL